MYGLIVILLSFFYFYTPDLVFLPLSIRVIIGYLGAFWFLAEEVPMMLKYGSERRYDRRVLFTLFSVLSVMFSAFVFGPLNGTFDMAFIRSLTIQFVVLFGASYFIFSFIRMVGWRTGYITPVNIIIIITTIQCLISLLMFVSPAAKQFFDAIQRETTDTHLQSLVSKSVNTYRILGFGTSFFGAGIEVVFALICIVAVIRGTDRMPAGRLLLYAAAFAVNAGVGILMARTTFIGILLSALFLFYPVRRTQAARQFGYIFILFFVVMLVLVMGNLAQSGAFLFAFEALINLQAGNGLVTESSEDLKNMYLWPTDLHVYLLGRGMMNDAEVPGRYFMGVDVGYLRLIYFGGVLFLVLWMWSQYNLMKQAVINLSPAARIYGPLAFVILVFLLIANAKGLSEYYSRLIFIYCYSVFFSRSESQPAVITGTLPELKNTHG